MNNDKRIADKDRVLKGQPLPLFTFGGSIALSYKNFDFNALFTGVAGWDRYLSTGIFSLTNAETERLFLKQFHYMQVTRKIIRCQIIIYMMRAF